MKFARERALNVNVSFDYWLLLTLFSTQLHFPVAILSPQVDFFTRKFTVKYVFIHVSMYIYLIYIDNDALYFLHRITPLSNMSGWKWGTTSMFVLDFVTYVCANAYTATKKNSKAGSPGRNLPCKTWGDLGQKSQPEPINALKTLIL